MLLRKSLLLIPAAALTACGGSQPPPKHGPAEVGVVTLRAEPVTMTTELTGRTAATALSEVRPQVDGIIKQRLFEEGSFVRAGQPLYQIDARLYAATRNQAAAQLASARAALVTAQAKLTRYRQLGDADAVSKQDIDDATATVRQGQASVNQNAAALRFADVNLGFTRVYAPISGRIGRSTYTQGALVTASQATALATIQRLDPIYVDIQQSSDAVLALRESLAHGHVLPASTKVQLILGNGRVYPQAGRIEFGEVTVDQDSGTVTLRARFPNPNGLLLPGMFVRVRAPQAVLGSGILAPQQGISRDARGNATALVVDLNGKVEQRQVTVTQAIGDKWLVTAGLNAGDRLIVEGTDKAQPGAQVKAVAIATRAR